MGTLGTRSSVRGSRRSALATLGLIALALWLGWGTEGAAQTPAAPTDPTLATSPPSKPKVTDYWGAANGSISAAAIIIGGVVGLRRYRKERPYFARANLSLTAELVADDQGEYVLANVGAQSIGKKRLELVPSDVARGELGCFVAIYPYRGEAANRPWTNPITAVRVFVQQSIESGETIEEALMIPVGRPDAGVLAYRVEFGLAAVDSEAGGETFAWRSTLFVPARVQPQ